MAAYIRPRPIRKLPIFDSKIAIRKMSGMDWDYPNPFEAQEKKASSKEKIPIDIPKRKQGGYGSKTPRYQICGDRRPTQKYILEKLKSGQEQSVHDLTYLQPSRTPGFLPKIDE